jgi:hypothetical protein
MTRAYSAPRRNLRYLLACTPRACLWRCTLRQFSPRYKGIAAPIGGKPTFSSCFRWQSRSSAFDLLQLARDSKPIPRLTVAQELPEGNSPFKSINVEP